MTTSSLRRRHAPRRRAAFTIVELLMVIVVIGILAALLIPAIQRAIQRAHETEVVAEISGLEKGILDFKGRYGIDPPSFIVLYEQGGGIGDPDWNTDTMSGLADAHRRASRAFIRQIWPDFDFTYGGTAIDINGNGATDDVIILNGAECLVFFLGGVSDHPVALPSNPNGWAPLGFSANPQYPFAAGGNRIGPFVTFDPARLVDLDGDDMPEYRDVLNGQELPYQYLSSYAGRGYQPYGLDGQPGASATDPLALDNELLQASFAFIRIYYESPQFTAAQWISNTAPQLDMNTDGTAETVARPFNPDSCQILSPGLDFEYGLGGSYNGEGVPSDRAPERDNITNFKGGRLN